MKSLPPPPLSDHPPLSLPTPSLSAHPLFKISASQSCVNLALLSAWAGGGRRHRVHSPFPPAGCQDAGGHRRPLLRLPHARALRHHLADLHAGRTDPGAGTRRLLQSHVDQPPAYVRQLGRQPHHLLAHLFQVSGGLLEVADRTAGGALRRLASGVGVVQTHLRWQVSFRLLCGSFLFVPSLRLPPSPSPVPLFHFTFPS